MDYSGSASRDRVQENLSKAFSLLDDDQPKNYGAPSNFYGGNQSRIGTAPPGGGGYGMGGAPKSNYTGSDFGDSEIGDTTSQMRNRGMGLNDN